MGFDIFSFVLGAICWVVLYGAMTTFDYLKECTFQMIEKRERNQKEEQDQ